MTKQKNKGFKVAIFPGHVGKDPGAVDPAEAKDTLYTVESVVNGAISVLLKTKLDALMIDSDIYIGTLESCVKDSVGCALGISIHCDASPSEMPNGRTIFYHPKSEEGLHFAELLESRLSGAMAGKIESRGIKQESFFMLRKPDFPSILLECGFITNPRDEIHLNRYPVQDAIAGAIARAVYDYRAAIV